MIKKSGEMDPEAAKVQKILGEPVICEFSEKTWKIRTTLFAVSVVSLVVVIANLHIEPGSTVFGLQFSGLTDDVVRIGAEAPPRLKRALENIRDMDYWKLTTLILAVFAAYTAFWQYQLGRVKFKLDLFEKRFKVFSGARLFLTHVMHNGNVTMENIWEYRAAIGESSFLFSEDIVNYLEDIYRRAVKLQTDHETMRPLPVGPERTRLAGEISKGIGWLTDQLPELKKRFAPFMAFDKWK